ncbi:MAG: transcriptional regulator, LacI family [Ilumatobacteraceae bacterium]|nr:transcriptional regulator, LacI family [Ilumatobacteraceae bacterium]
MTTLAAVAARAGVGIGTVSRVLNQHPSVSERMRVRVEGAMVEVGYVRPSRIASRDQLPPSGQVGVLVPFFDEPSAYQRLRGVVSRLQPHDLNIVLYNVASPGQARDHIARIAPLKHLDALIVVSLPMSDADARVLASARFPTLLLDTSSPYLPSVGIDDRHGGRLATQHLLDVGHRRIGFVGEPPQNLFGFVSSARRQEGYQSSLVEAGVDVDPTLIRHGAHLRAAARRMAVELLELAEPPTAIVAASDVQAVGVMEAADQLRRQIPDDLSVVGYDDIDLAALMGITTVRQPLERSGRRVADLVVQAIGGSERTVFVEQMDLELVVRSTTGPLRSSTGPLR